MGLFGKKDRVETPRRKARREEAGARGVRRAAARSRAAGHADVAAELEKIAQVGKARAARLRGGR